RRSRAPRPSVSRSIRIRLARGARLHPATVRGARDPPRGSRDEIASLLPCRPRTHHGGEGSGRTTEVARTSDQASDGRVFSAPAFAAAVRFQLSFSVLSRLRPAVVSL